MPDISVIIPVYNVEHYLRRCLDSVVNQQYDSFEIICIDDCSPDNSKAILSEFQSNYPDLVTVLCNEKNLGLGRTREKGIEASNGSHILFVDSDDYIAEDYISTYANAAIATPDADIIIGGYIRDIEGSLTTHRATNSIWSVVTYPIACAKLFKKTFLQSNNIHFSDVRCGEDIYFSLSSFFHHPAYRIIDYSGYYYFYNKHSITGSLDPNSNHEQFISTIFRSFLEAHDINTLNDMDRWIIEYAFVANMVNALVTYGKGADKQNMLAKINYVDQELETLFPECRNNPLLRFPGPKGQTKKIRFGVLAFWISKRLNIHRLLFSALAKIPF